MLIILAVIFLVPIYGTLVTSFKSINDIITGGFWKMPRHFTLEGYVEAWKMQNLGKYFINSVIITLPSVVGSIFIASLAAYPLSRIRFKGDKWIFMLFIAGLFLPPQIHLLPLFKLVNTLKIFDTYLALILTHIAFGLPICVFILRNFFASIPIEIQDAAKIDGCNDFSIFLKIILPLSKPALAVLAILQFTWIWNEFLWGLVLTQTEQARPLTVALYNLQGMFTVEWNVQTAGAMMATIPTLVVFLALQRYFIKGITLGAVKG
ncbi:MAG: carbohydrate ABC transporter permease [Candidatus Humimicrobiaceae bacterium]